MKTEKKGIDKGTDTKAKEATATRTDTLRRRRRRRRTLIIILLLIIVIRGSRRRGRRRCRTMRRGEEGHEDESL